MLAFNRSESFDRYEELLCFRVTLNGAQEDLMNTIDLDADRITFDMGDCMIYFGGVPPLFRADNLLVSDHVSSENDGESEKLELTGLLGSLRSITVSNPGANSVLNPLYAERHKHNPFYGVEPNCEQKVS